MKLDLKGRLLFLWVCFVQPYSTESFTWTVQPANLTFVTKGEDMSLTWKFTLSADEQAKSQTFSLIQWRKFNQTSSVYDGIASITFINLVGRPSYDEPRAPHIEIVRSDQATLLIKNVRTENEGTYKIEYSVQFGGTPIADHEINVTVLGYSYLHVGCGRFSVLRARHDRIAEWQKIFPNPRRQKGSKLPQILKDRRVENHPDP